MKNRRFSLLMTLSVMAFLYIPIVILMVNSFNISRYSSSWMGFSLKWYQKLFHDSGTWDAFFNSLFVAFTATAMATLLGTMAALGIYRYRGILQTIQSGLIYSPLAIPDILMGISLLLLFLAIGLDLGLLTVFIAHTTFCISYIALTVLSKLETFDYAVVEAAQDLGATQWMTLRKIILPLLSPGIISGALLAFTISFDDFIVTSFVAGPGATTLPLHVYGLIKFGSSPMINALSTLMITVTFTIVLVTQIFSKEEL